MEWTSPIISGGVTIVNKRGKLARNLADGQCFGKLVADPWYVAKNDIFCSAPFELSGMTRILYNNQNYV